MQIFHSLVFRHYFPPTLFFSMGMLVKVLFGVSNVELLSFCFVWRICWGGFSLQRVFTTAYTKSYANSRTYIHNHIELKSINKLMKSSYQSCYFKWMFMSLYTFKSHVSKHQWEVNTFKYHVFAPSTVQARRQQ